MAGQQSAKRAGYNRQYKAVPENRVKIRAREVVGYALRCGRMTRQSCEQCGAEKTHGHHDDYSKPLEVRWLCQPCHVAEHRNHQVIVPAEALVTLLPLQNHCRKGHPLTADNILYRGSTRNCRQCQRAGQRRHYWKHKQPRPDQPPLRIP